MAGILEKLLCSMGMTRLMSTAAAHRDDKQPSSKAVGRPAQLALRWTPPAAPRPPPPAAQPAPRPSSAAWPACPACSRQDQRSVDEWPHTQHPACLMVAVPLTISMQLPRKRLQHGNIHIWEHEYAHSLRFHVEGVILAGNSHFHQLRQLDGLRSSCCRRQHRQDRPVRTAAYSWKVATMLW